MGFCLETYDDLGNLKRLPLEKSVFTLGRQVDSDMLIPGAGVSRHHAEIVAEGDAFFLVDQNSKCGTFVNGAKIAKHRLHHRDVIHLGSITGFGIRFIDEQAPAEATGKGLEEVENPWIDISPRVELENLARFLEVNRALKVSLSIEEVLSLIVDSAVEISRADRGALLLRDNLGELKFRVARDRNRKSLQSGEFGISQTILDQVLRQGRSVIADSNRRADLPDSESAEMLRLGTMACIPLQPFRMHERIASTVIHRADTIGILYVDSRQGSTVLSKASATLLESLAFEASRALESVRLMQEEQEKIRLEGEISLAREVQLALLTSSRLDLGSFEIAAHSVPSRFVDGDFYDLLPLGENRAALVLGDVSGKGISAALLAAMAQGVLETQLQKGVPLESILSCLNELLLRKTPSWRFITLFCGILELDGRFTFANAGHIPPIALRASGQVELLSSDSMVVGALNSAVYTTSEVRLTPGDLVLAYTDGLTEASDARSEMFGEERLLTLLRSISTKTAQEILDRVLKEVASYTRGLPQEDDITVLALKFKTSGHQAP